MKSSPRYKKAGIWPGLLFFWCCAFLLPACQTATSENRMPQITQACCDCSARLLDMNQQAAQSPEKADFKALEAEFQNTKTCLDTAITRLGKLKPEELPELEKQLQPKCPGLAAQHDLLRQLLAE